MSTKRTDNIGSLSRNRKKETEKHPDHRGSCTVAGVQYWISAYINEGEDGGKYFRLYFEPKKIDSSEVTAKTESAPDPEIEPW